VEHDRVDVVVGEVQSPGVALLERDVAQSRRQLPGPGDEHRRRVDPDHLGDLRTLGEHPRHRPRPAPGLRDSRRRRQLDLRQVGVEHGPLLRVRGPHLEDAGQPLLHRGVDLGDDGVDIRHRNPPVRGRLSISAVADCRPVVTTITRRNGT
jgi:hypothetical protein